MNLCVKKSKNKNREILLEILKQSRIDAGLRQVDLADRLGVPQSMVSKYEVGERRLDVLELRDICEALGLSLTGFVKNLEEALGSAEHEAD